MRVLVSLTNKFGKSKIQPDICLLEIDSYDGKIKPIPTNHYALKNPLAGIAGLVRYQDGIIFFTDGCKIGRLDNQYQVTDVGAIPIEQAHTAVWVDDKLYIAATHQDCVIESAPFQDKHQVFWEDNGGRKDTIHLNSIAYHNGAFYVTAFGPRKDFWHSAEAGYVKNITTGEIAVSGLKQPHTLCSVMDGTYPGGLYFCNSSSGEVCLMGSEDRLLVDSRSYIRGMSFSDDILAVTTSKGRSKSKSTGKELVTNFTDPGQPIGHCAISFYQRASRLNDYKKIRTVLLDSYGSEIFDVLSVDGFVKKSTLWEILMDSAKGLLE
jgi:uncharacterized protein DUF4915